MTDEEILRRAREIDKEIRNRHQEDRYQRFMRERAEQAAKDRAFAASIGVTWEQFLSVEDYTIEKWENER